MFECDVNCRIRCLFKEEMWQILGIFSCILSHQVTRNVNFFNHLTLPHTTYTNHFNYTTKLTTSLTQSNLPRKYRIRFLAKIKSWNFFLLGRKGVKIGSFSITLYKYIYIITFTVFGGLYDPKMKINNFYWVI